MMATNSSVDIRMTSKYPVSAGSPLSWFRPHDFERVLRRAEAGFTS